MFSAVARITARKVIKPFRLKNYVINKGTKITVSIRGNHFSTSHFDNPEEFNPERFTEEGIKGRHRLSNIPFYYGRRDCIGKSFGELLARMLITHTLKNFELKKPEGHIYEFNDEFIVKVVNPVLHFKNRLN